MVSQDEFELLKEEFSSLPEEEQQRIMSDTKQQCIFCLIAEGKVPAKKIYEDDDFLAILDIYPASKGHIILFSKKHVKIISELPNEIFSVAKNLVSALKQISQGVNLFIAEGELAGQKAEHIVTHLIPRYKDDKIPLVWQPKKMSEEDLDKVQKEIISRVVKPKKKEAMEIPKQKISKEKISGINAEKFKRRP